MIRFVWTEEVWKQFVLWIWKWMYCLRHMVQHCSQGGNTINNDCNIRNSA